MSGSLPGQPAKTSNIETDSLSKMDRVILAVGLNPLSNPKAILDAVRSMGLAKDLTTNTISSYLSRGRYFYWSEEDKSWKLTELVGKRRFEELTDKPKTEENPAT